jgi:hypothetical protein
MKKQFITICIILSVWTIQSQDGIRVGVWQDLRMAITGGHTDSYEAPTLDLLVKLKLMGNQTGAGYLVVSPSFEYADLEGIYKRYFVDVGFTFNKSLVEGLEVTPSINYGIQDRWGGSFNVFGTDLEVSIPVSRRLRVSALGQAVQRKDLDFEYGGHNVRFSGFIGVQYELCFNIKPKDR